MSVEYRTKVITFTFFQDKQGICLRYDKSPQAKVLLNKFIKHD